MSNSMSKLFPTLLLIGGLLIGGCGGSSSGQQNAPGINPDANVRDDQGVVYNGPAAQTDDIQSFKVNVWDNLAGEDRCGGCHNQSVGQEPQFVRSDDINLAYESALTIVDKSAPVLSRMVEKVAGGHNCWRDQASVCADTITNFIQQWADATGASENVIVLTAPNEREPGVSLQFPADATAFETTVWPLVRGEGMCFDCHAEDGSRAQQQPYFASSNLTSAYQAAKTKIDLNNAADSRLVERMRERHNCWADASGEVPDPCTYSFNEMLAAVQAFLGALPEPQGVDESLVISRAVGLIDDGIIASSGGRVDTDVIAMYQFKTGAGGKAYDISGVEPPLDLYISDGVEWVGSWGLRFEGGFAYGNTADSKKLFDLIRATGEYSIETWVIPANVTQEGPARIVTYAANSDERNFTLGQTMYDYNFLSQSTGGMTTLSTPSADEVLQATLQHTVVTFDPIDGRRIYVNGEVVAEDATGGGSLSDWDDGFRLTLGNEADNQRPWAGTVRMLAIHNRVLGQESVQKNYDAGVGQKFFLLFGVSHLIDMPQAYVVFEVQVFDDFSYLFNKPFFISLDKAAVPGGDITIRGLRIGLNGKEVSVGQAFANVDVTINAANYDANQGVPLWSAAEGTVIALENGAADDLFFISFDSIGGNSYARPADDVPPLPAAVDLDAQSDIGLRTFGEINASLSTITQVPAQSVADSYALVIQQLPSDENAAGFLAAHQSGVMQLSLAYCTALVADQGLRASFFPGLDFDSATALDSDAGKDLVIQPLLNALLVNAGLTTQPDAGETRSELIDLMNRMTAANTPTTVTAVCSAAVGSAVMLMQ